MTRTDQTSKDELIGALNASRAELAVINAIQEALAKSLDLPGIYDAVGDRLKDIFSAQTIVIYSADLFSKKMITHYAFEKGQKFPTMEVPLNSLYRYVLSLESTYVRNGDFPEFAENFEDYKVPQGEMPLSVLVTPVIKKKGSNREVLIGLLDIDSGKEFSESDIHLVETVANSMRVALENARLFDETQRLLKETEERNAELAVINSVQEGLASKLDMKAIYHLVGDKIGEITGAGVVLIASWDWEARTLRAEYFQDQGEKIDMIERPFSSLHDALIPQLEDGKTVVVNEGVKEMYLKYDHEIAAGTLPLTLVSVPLSIGGKINTMISIQDTQTEYAFTESTIRLIETLARSMSIALENALLFDETNQRNAELAIVNSVSEAISKKLDVQTVVKIVGDKVQQIFHADMVGIGFVDEEKGVTEIPYSYSLGQYFEEDPIPIDKGLSGIVFRSRQPLLLKTAKELAELGAVKMVADKATEDQIQSWMGVPIIIGEKLIGGVSVQSYRPHAYSENDLSLLSTLATNMGSVIENARLFEETAYLLKETEERNAELAVINSVQAALAAELDMQGIYDAIGEKIREIFDAQTLMIGTLDHDTRLAATHYFIEKGERYYPDPLPFSGLIDHISKTGEKVVFNENMVDRTKEFGMIRPAGEEPKSGIWMPYKIGNQVRGIITLQNMDREHAFTDSDVRLLETLANSMSVALENARLFEELQRSNREISEALERQTAISEILHIISNSPGEIQPVLDSVAEHAATLCEADDVQIYRVENERIIEIAHFGPLPALKDAEYLPLDPGLVTGRAILERRTIHTDAGNLSQDDYPISVELQQRLKHRSVIITPLIREENAIGAIVARRNQVQEFSQNQISLLKTFSDQAAIAIENVRLFEETKRLLAESQQQAEELKTVNTVSRALSSELELNALIELIGSQVKNIFSADIAYVALLDKESGYIDFPFSAGEKTEKIRFGEGLTSRVIQSGEPLLINQDEEWRKTDKRIGVKSKSYLGVPIFLGKEAIGAISVQSTKWSNMYGNKDVRLLSTIAGSVGAAFQNANLFNEIKRQKEYYEALITSAPVAIITGDLQGRVTGWSPAAETLFGYTDQEAWGEKIDDLIANHPDVRKEAEYYTTRFLQETGRIQLKAQRSHKDGHLIDVAINAMPVHIEGVLSGYIAIYNDISELEKARRDAEEANQAKSTFLANMSHELRTPLNAIIGFTRIVKRKGDQVLPEKQIENLEKVLVSAEHLLGLINTVLDISKIEAGRMEVHASNFDLKSLIDLVAVTTQPLLSDDGVRFESTIANDIPMVYSDIEKIKQILINLVSNAAKFTHQGGIKLQASAENEEIKIDVIDTGIGIPPEALEHIFEEFQQADSSTTREYGGTGLGLSISRSLARLLGGDLSAISEVGSGSTFTFSFPAIYGQSKEVVQSIPDRVDLDAAKPLVLMIEDNQDAIYLMQDMLKSAGYRVAVARDGEEGLSMALELEPFAITLDIMMPKKDGWQVLHDLKANPVTKLIPVILISIVDQKALGYRLGAEDYLVKPLKEDEFLLALQKIKSRGDERHLKKLLVVDDDPNVLDMISQLLEGKSYQIEGAVDGLDALEKMKTNTPDAVLLDLMMPRLDGFGLIEKIKKIPDLANLPIIVLTAKLLQEQEKEALKHSVGQVIQKRGLSGEELLSEIRQTIHNIL